MQGNDNVTRIRGPIPFTVDGQRFETDDRVQQAAAILAIAGLDASLYDLGEVVGQRAEPKRYHDQDRVTIRREAKFVSIRHAADVA